MELYERIRRAIPPGIFTPAGVESAAIDIYLTAKGVRPACIPFDGEVAEGGKSANEMFAILSKKPSLLKALKAIPEITVRVGPYYDTDDAIAVLCTEQLGTTQPILDRLEELRTMNRKDSLPEIHVLMGTLLGYTCPIDLEALYKEPSLYDIGFVIDDIAHMPVWCPKKAKYATTARKQLRAINQALKPLGKKATLSLKAIKGVRLHTTRKKKRQS